MSIDKSKKTILCSFLQTIEWISNKEYQRRAWVLGEPPGTDFDETVNFFFDDGDPILQHYKEFEITEGQYRILLKLRNQFKDFSKKNDWPPKFIDTPEWNEITEMAKEVLQVFNFQSSARDEK